MAASEEILSGARKAMTELNLEKVEKFIQLILYARNKKIFVIPVLIQDCEIPPLLKHKRFIDFRKSYDNGIQELLEFFKQE
jgi:hypothetical protein